ncbi:methyltransferase family protein [Thermodesulfobacteriota bacterium]
MRPGDLLYSVTTGSRRLRILLTPVGFVVFAGMLLLVIFGSLYMDRALDFPKLLSGKSGFLIGLILLAAGLLLLAWCVAWFRRAKGTPVPFNPPQEIVTVGPYAWSRNPMLTGVFACLFGLGFFLNSISMVLIWTPMFVLIHVLELKLVEEPELERRFGESYADYKRRVPMFVPRVSGVGRSKRR